MKVPSLAVSPISSLESMASCGDLPGDPCVHCTRIAYCLIAHRLVLAAFINGVSCASIFSHMHGIQTMYMCGPGLHKTGPFFVSHSRCHVTCQIGQRSRRVDVPDITCNDFLEGIPPGSMFSCRAMAQDHALANPDCMGSKPFSRRGLPLCMLGTGVIENWHAGSAADRMAGMWNCALCLIAFMQATSRLGEMASYI